jgi:hypothetical protein
MLDWNPQWTVVQRAVQTYRFRRPLTALKIKFLWGRRTDIFTTNSSIRTLLQLHTCTVHIHVYIYKYSDSNPAWPSCPSNAIKKKVSFRPTAAVAMWLFNISSCHLHPFSGALANLRKATISFVMSVRLSVRVQQLGSYWTDFHEISYLSVFRKSVEKV